MDPVTKLIDDLRTVIKTPTVANFLSTFKYIFPTQYRISKRPDTLFGKGYLPIKWDGVYVISFIPKSDLISDIEFKLDVDLSTDEPTNLSSWQDNKDIKVSVFAFCTNPTDIINSTYYMSSLI